MKKTIFIALTLITLNSYAQRNLVPGPFENTQIDTLTNDLFHDSVIVMKEYIFDSKKHIVIHYTNEFTLTILNDSGEILEEREYPSIDFKTPAYMVFLDDYDGNIEVKISSKELTFSRKFNN